MSSGAALAQPGGTPVYQPVPAPYYGPTNNYHLLSAEERELLLQGKISTGQTWGGAALAYMFGFGLGHAVQGRYEEVGWKFTVGELAAIGGLLYGVSMAIREDDQGRYYRDQLSPGETVMVVSLVGWGVLRVWQIIDTLTGPAAHNRKYNMVHWKAYGRPPGYSLFVTPSTDKSGGVAGLRWQF